MTFHITLGAGNRSVKGRSKALDSVQDLAQALIDEPSLVEGWWSGHVWHGHSRKKPVAWESTQLAIVDCDYHDKTGKHAARVSDLDLSLVPCSLAYLTPRGARFVFVLDSVVTDGDLAGRLQRAAGALVNQALAAGGELADRDEKGKPVNGYLADAQAMDLGRFMYRARCIVKDEARVADVVCSEDLFSVPDILGFESLAGSFEAPKSDVGKLLGAMNAEGEQDGSLALIKVCARAVRLGITTFESFLAASATWNAKRARPWSEDDMRGRFEDALERFRGQGMVLVPTDDKGRPAYSPEILDRILREDTHYDEQLSFDGVKGQLLWRGEPLKDSDFTRIRVDISERYGFKTLPKSDVIDAVIVACEGRSFDKIKDYLEGLKWDGVSRLDLVAREVLGADGELAASMVRRWFISAVARGLQPGCKVDTCLILQGPQGIYKSTFFRQLVPHDDLFTDSMPHDLTDKDAREVMGRFWLVEYGEWEGLYKKTDISALRTFLSTLSDSYRPPYGRVTKTQPRRAVLVGTVNPREGILRDPEGSRRQWVVECQGQIDLSLLEQVKDQLWSEAVVAYRAGEQWWLTETEDEARAEVAADRYTEDDPEVEALQMAVEHLLKDAKIQAQGHVTMSDIAKKLGLFTVQDLKMSTARKAGRVLRESGFSKRKIQIEKNQFKAWELPSGAVRKPNLQVVENTSQLGAEVRAHTPRTPKL